MNETHSTILTTTPEQRKQIAALAKKLKKNIPDTLQVILEFGLENL